MTREKFYISIPLAHCLQTSLARVVLPLPGDPCISTTCRTVFEASKISSRGLSRTVLLLSPTCLIEKQIIRICYYFKVFVLIPVILFGCYQTQIYILIKICTFKNVFCYWLTILQIKLLKVLLVFKNTR